MRAPLGRLCLRLRRDALTRAVCVRGRRLLNLDRNDANILVKMEHTDPPPGVRWEDHEPEVKLIPIDHGYCLPSTLNVGWCDWVWYEWPQAKVRPPAVFVGDALCRTMALTSRPRLHPAPTQKPFDAETLAYIAALDPDADARMLRDGFSIREECIKCVLATCVSITLNHPPNSLVSCLPQHRPYHGSAAEEGRCRRHDAP